MLCAGAARCANVCLACSVVVSAIRFGINPQSLQDADVDGELHVSQVVGQVGSLLQEHLGVAAGGRAAGVLQAALAVRPKPWESEGEQPTAMHSLHTIVEGLISKMSELGQTIKSHHNKTQDAVDGTLNSLRLKTSVAVKSYKAAVADDAAWIDCVAEETKSLEGVKGAGQALVEAKNTKSVHCWQAPHPAAARCSEATIEVERRTEAAEFIQRASLDTHQECKLKRKAAHASKCRFGRDLQEKCAAAAEMTVLLQQVNAINGTEHSHPDRVHEWRVTQMTKCLLSKVAADATLSKAVTRACDAMVDYERDVGTLGLKTKAMAALMSPERFTCEEKAISFSAGKKAPLNLKDTGAPFMFCQADDIVAQAETVQTS